MPYAKPLSNDEFEKLIAECPFASGGARDVFVVPIDPNVVVKRLNRTTLTNFAEWYIWAQIKDTDLASAFGQCITISPDSSFLMMEKLENLDPTDAEITLAIPDWVRDVTFKAFGKNSAGQIKLRDYGMVNLRDALVAARRQRRRLMPAERRIRLV
jgi:hypothetical protein